MDHRGHGGSDRFPSRYRVCDFADDAIRLVNTHLHEGVVVYGHSLGALVAAAVASTCPDRVRAIILEDPPAPSFLRDVVHSAWYPVWLGMRELAGSAEPVAVVAQKLAEIRQPTATGSVRLGDLRDAASLRFSARCLRDVDPEVFASLLGKDWLEDFDVDRTFANVLCPALLLRGDTALGGMLPRGEAEAMTARMTEGLLVDVPNVGHLIHLQAAEATTRLVLNFLESL
jgi:pimeloyl-ACP methyl ester carboxylesterase